MAGELTHIIPTHPSDPNYRASKTRGITWCDANGVAHTITAVYWSPTNNVNDRKLIWQLSNDVPYDNTCTATITLSQDKTSWIVTITKDGEDVTSSLSQMITWIYNGKGERVLPHYAYSNTIDLSQFPRGDYRLDLSRITSKAGGYFPGTGSISVPEHIYIGQLVAGSQNVAIEYVPESDIAVTDIGIFTSQNNSGNPHIKIFHESGLCVAAVDGDTITTGQEIYGLSGSKHDTTISSTTLYAGQKYYVVYSNGYAQFYPAYFMNESGNYKEYENEETASQTTIIDVSPTASTYKTTKYKGLLTSLDAALGYSQYDWFTWVGSSTTLNGGHVYQRTATGTTYAYGGSVGDANNHHTITNNDLMTIINMNIDSQFWWYINDYSGMTKGDIYAKVTGTWQSATLVDISQYNDEKQKTAAILMALQNNGDSVMVGGETTFWYNNRIGYIMKLKSGYTSKVTSTTPLTSLPSNPTTGEIYYLDGSIGQAVNYQTACFAYTGSSWTEIHNQNYTNYLDETPLSNLLTHIGSKSDLFSDVNNGTYNLVTATVKNSKYYLKINGKEV